MASTKYELKIGVFQNGKPCRFVLLVPTNDKIVNIEEVGNGKQK